MSCLLHWLSLHKSGLSQQTVLNQIITSVINKTTGINSENGHFQSTEISIHSLICNCSNFSTLKDTLIDCVQRKIVKTILMTHHNRLHFAIKIFAIYASLVVQLRGNLISGWLSFLSLENSF